MINKDTVFILGAGASMPYGFPSGKKLRELICSLGNQNNTKGAIVYQQFSGVAHNFIHEFKHSHVASIDAFLARHPKYEEVGKFTIALLLSGFENRHKLEAPIDPDGDWYFYLWNILLDGAEKAKDILKNRIKVITFNYDRSLEHYLFTSIQNTFTLPSHETLDIVKQLNILHIYGSLDEYGLSHGGTPRTYTPLTDPSLIRSSANCLKIIPEIRDDTEELDKARKWLSESSNVFILGFGYDALNLERLNYEEILNSHRPNQTVTISATTRYMTEGEVRLAKKNLMGKLAGTCDTYFEDMDCLQMLKTRVDYLISK